MWTFVQLDENQNYKLIHPEYGTMVVGAYSETNESGAHNESEAIAMAENAFIENE